MKLILASSSPRRHELLALLGVPFVVQPADIDETPRPHEAALDYVRRMAAEKAEKVWQRLVAGAESEAETWVLGSDTSVVVDGEILGKPVDEHDALRMLRLLSGRVHEVITAVSLHGVGGADVRCSVTDVEFTTMSDAEMIQYWHSGEPSDKAGAYGIQGRGARFVRSISGSYHAVMGLPVDVVADMLVTAGFRLWQEE
ncbi:Maf family nucleotide pyrophosphatase [Salinispirillum sp. LH 10-3-1]|uniref:dTTP/UTP pyrophosphatase n=1 Tax=Salinispirillum sp. LH 10-3-1 TaxID=2952525 RepID=A0AB38YDE9_9GAMM